MVKCKGFLLLEIALALILISSFFVIVVGYVHRMAQWHKEAHARMQAINYISSYLESMRHHHSYANHTSNEYTITIDEKTLSNCGRWSPSLPSSEAEKLCNQLRLVSLTIEWHGQGSNHSCNLIALAPQNGERL